MRPLPLTAEMALAAILGKKTETRRPLVLHGGDKHDLSGAVFEVRKQYSFLRLPNGHEFGGPIRAPFGLPGTRLWLREPGRVGAIYHRTEDLPALDITYAADGHCRRHVLPERMWDEAPPSWVRAGRGIPNGIFREAARYFTTVKAVRVERLQDITDDAAVADLGCWRYCDEDEPCDTAVTSTNPVGDFHDLWDRIYGKRPGLAWADNPWVTVTAWDKLEASA